jgi:CheY-like chemotaxis protein
VDIINLSNKEITSGLGKNNNNNGVKNLTNVTHASSFLDLLESNTGPAAEVVFLEHSHNFCIAIVDIVGSTNMTMKIIEPKKIRTYYGIFLNITSKIAKSFGAKIVKNLGDSLMFYFPDTADTSNQFAFRDALECCSTMISARDLINANLHLQHLPCDISYRISADYGSVEVARSVSSNTFDLFGTTVNVCSKINSMAPPNGIVLGGDLYRIVQSFSFKDYYFKQIGSYSFGLKQSYSVYGCKSKNEKKVLENSSITNLFASESEFSDAEDSVSSSSTTSISSYLTSEIMSNKDDNLSDQKKARMQKISASSANIMLVDDEPDVLLTLKSFLIQEGYNAEIFSDSCTALKRFEDSDTRHYDLVVLDIRMPKINGIQLFKRLKAIDPDIKIVFASSLDMAHEILSVLPDLRPDNIIKKPILRDHFIRTIQSSLAKA